MTLDPTGGAPKAATNPLPHGACEPGLVEREELLLRRQLFVRPRGLHDAGSDRRAVFCSDGRANISSHGGTDSHACEPGLVEREELLLRRQLFVRPRGRPMTLDPTGARRTRRADGTAAAIRTSGARRVERTRRSALELLFVREEPRPRGTTRTRRAQLFGSDPAPAPAADAAAADDGLSWDLVGHAALPLCLLRTRHDSTRTSSWKR